MNIMRKILHFAKASVSRYLAVNSNDCPYVRITGNTWINKCV